MQDEFTQKCLNLGMRLIGPMGHQMVNFRVSVAPFGSHTDANLVPFYTDVSQMLLEFYENHDAESSTKE